MSTSGLAGAYHGAMTAATAEASETYVLKVTDRCDRCGAQAYVSVTKDGWPQELLFCGHHGRIHLPALMLIDGVWIVDETERLYDDAGKMKTATTEV